MSIIPPRNSSSDARERERTRTTRRITTVGETVTVRHLGTIDLREPTLRARDGSTVTEAELAGEIGRGASSSTGWRDVCRSMDVGSDAHGGRV